jgi:dihydroneopterin aldolase
MTPSAKVVTVLFKYNAASNSSAIHSTGRPHIAPRLMPIPNPWILKPAARVDTIFISDFRLEILIGVYEWERRVPQTVQLDLEFALPARDKRSDRIGDTIDYAKVVSRIHDSLAHNRFLLVEALAEHICQIVLTEFGAPWIRASVTKLAALKGVKRLGITIERGARP